MEHLSDLEPFKEFLGTTVYPFLGKLPGALLVLPALWIISNALSGVWLLFYDTIN